MQEIVRFEKKRSRLYVATLIIIVISVAVVVVASGTWTVEKLIERNTLELLQLFTQDKEIISEYWEDALSVVVAELPNQSIMIGGISVLFLFLLWFFTRKFRKVLRRRVTELAKQRKYDNNK